MQVKKHKLERTARSRLSVTIADIDFIDYSILRSVMSLKSKLLFQGLFSNKRQDNSTLSGRSVLFASPAPNPKNGKKWNCQKTFTLILVLCPCLSVFFISFCFASTQDFVLMEISFFFLLLFVLVARGWFINLFNEIKIRQRHFFFNKKVNLFCKFAHLKKQTKSWTTCAVLYINV